jgi:hypothetical protein
VSDIDVQTLSVTGRYLLLLEGAIQASGVTSYELKVQRVRDNVGTLVIGATTTGSIEHTGQQDLYRFTLAGAAQLYFDVLSNTPGLRFLLNGPRGRVVEWRNFASSDATLSGSPVLDLVAGEHALTIDGIGDATGAYAFRMLDLSTSSPFAPGAVVVGQLSPGSQTQAYQFSAVAGEQFSFERQGLSGGSPYWRLLDPYGRVVFGPSSFSNVATQTLPAARAGPRRTGCRPRRRR